MEKEFFDQALFKAKEAFDIAREKTNKAVSVQRQRLEIISLNGKLEKDYAGLGKIFFEQIEGMEDLPDNVRELVESIVDKTEKIDALNLEIAQTQNKKICPDCQNVMSENALFCSRCGLSFTDEE